MGKGSVGASWWAFLLLAGVLLVVAATAGAEDGVVERDRKEDLRWCKQACEWQYGKDTPRKRECESECRERHQQADAGEDGDSGVDAYERGGSRDSDVDEDDSDRRCQMKCRRHSDRQARQWCVQRCERKQQEDAAADDDENSDRCQKRCQHHSDWMKRLRCMQRCGRQEEGGARDDADDEASHGDRCEKKCQQHHRDYDKKQQCVRDCRRGRGWETVAGAILEVV
ncbi:Antimicrobial peptide [Zea mays]|uniref:Antimicrobial peptide n=1 Tax=Zea mays TaxID=4577 RepID=A0A3L6F2A7_MAIZE|nr:Antimicrobial peptide [Zea mays]